MASLEEQLSEQFYRWERRGRGRSLFEHPVELEPPLVPFTSHYLTAKPAADDGRRETALTSFVKGLRELLTPGATREPPLQWEEEAEPEPEPFVRREKLTELAFLVPPGSSGKKEAHARFLQSLSACAEPVAFEIIGQTEGCAVQFAASASDAQRIRIQAKSYHPEAVCLEREGWLDQVWTQREGCEAAIIEFGLAKEFMVPLLGGGSFGLDPLLALFSALAGLEGEEVALVQVLFTPNRKDWAESIVRSVSHPDGRAFFVNAPELLDQARKKAAERLYSVVVRIAVQSPEEERLRQIAASLYGAFSIFSTPQGNELVALSNEGYDFLEHEADLLSRESRRCGMILNAEELLALVHLPWGEIPQWSQDFRKTKAAPACALGKTFVLGKNVHAGRRVEVTLSAADRVQHMHLIGVSGTGKSTLLLNLIAQDIAQGEGVAVLDPHGDLIDRILEHIPEDRLEDVILIDPSDEEYFVGFNILEAHSSLERSLLASDLVSIFERLSTSWGDQMASVLQNAILAFLESSRGGTLADLRRFLLDGEYRNEFLGTVSDEDIVFYWKKVFTQLTGNKSIGPILTRLDAFLGRKEIRQMVCQRAKGLDFAAIMDRGKILLARLSQGQIGKENAYLLGSFFVSRFQQLAMSRQRQKQEERRNFWLYLDEAHHFITPSMAEILSGARKYRLGLIFAHQELRQLDRNAEVASAVLSHPYTRIVFRVGDSDARALQSGFSFFDASDLQNLGTFEAIGRMERTAFDFNLRISRLPEGSAEERQSRREQAIARSRERHGTLRTAVTPPAEPPDEAKPDPVPPAAHKAERREPVSTPPPQAEPPVSPLSPVSNPSPVPAPKPPCSPKEEQKPDVPKTGPADLGRGGARHKALQHRLKVAAEALGFGATIEKNIPNGSIDLFLERAGLALACELSFTTTIDHEVGNVVKCLKAGFEVAVVCIEEGRLQKIERAVRACLQPAEASRVAFYLADALLEHLQSLPVPEQKPKAPTLKLGKYKVTTSHAVLTEEEKKAKEAEIGRILASSLRKKPKKK